jgi:hypothetical protein
MPGLPPARHPAGGRALSTGPGRQAAGMPAVRPGRRAGWALGAVALAAGAALAVSACGSASKYPSFLPKASLRASSDSILSGSVADPALTVEGDPVEVVTPTWKVLVDVTGPAVPGEGLPQVQPATYCTWIIELSHATGDVPVSIDDFRPIDQLGHTYFLSLPPGQAPPPAVVRPGQTVTFEVRAFEATGEGLMRWAPDGNHIVAKWDYVVEND